MSWLRDRKLNRRMRGMRISGSGVKTLLRIVERKVEDARRVAKGQATPPRTR